MTLKVAILSATSTVLLAASVAAHDGPHTVVIPQADLTWKDMGSGGVMAATVSGDMSKGPSRFFLKYPPGLVTPNHHHTADHHATMISGTITLTVDGKDHKLGPGSHFVLAEKAPHVAKVEGSEPALFYIEAEGAWDVVTEK